MGHPCKHRADRCATVAIPSQSTSAEPVRTMTRNPGYQAEANLTESNRSFASRQGSLSTQDTQIVSTLRPS